jgi:hypothetical protein
MSDPLVTITEKGPETASPLAPMVNASSKGMVNGWRLSGFQSDIAFGRVTCRFGNMVA